MGWILCLALLSVILVDVGIRWKRTQRFSLQRRTSDGANVSSIKPSDPGLHEGVTMSSPMTSPSRDEDSNPVPGPVNLQRYTHHQTVFECDLETYAQQHTLSSFSPEERAALYAVYRRSRGELRHLRQLGRQEAQE